MRAPRWRVRGSKIALATLVLVAGLAASPAAAEEPDPLEVSCNGAQLNLEAHSASAVDVFEALEEECDLILKGKENIPHWPLTAIFRNVTLEEGVEGLIRLTGLTSTLLDTDPSGGLKLAVLSAATRGPGPSRSRSFSSFRSGERSKRFKDLEGGSSRWERYRSRGDGEEDEERRQAIENWKEKYQSGDFGKRFRERRQED